MSNAFYNRMQATATRLVTKFGRTVTLTREVEGAVDPASGTVTPGTPITYTGKGIDRDFNATEIDGSAVIRGDKQLILADPEQIPLMNDLYGDYRVINVQEVTPAGINIIYRLQVRR
jgi:hypothetical protein